VVDTKSNQEDINSSILEDARIGYQAAIQLWTYEGGQNWARFNVMLVANSIIIAVLGLAITSANPSTAISVVLSVVGVILCIAWFLITKRGFDYQKYYVLSARELEEKFLSKVITTASRGGAFADGKPVSIEIGGAPKKIRMGWWSRKTSAGNISIIVILLFAVVYVFALLQVILKIS